MRIRTILLTFLLVLVGAVARADHAAIDLRLVVSDGGTPYATREGDTLRLGPSLLTAPFEIEGASVSGASVQLTLAPATARSFATLTAAHRGERLAIVVGHVVQGAPVIRAPITGGKVSITLGSPEEAAALARALTQ
ncbi:MAG TPA: hypothetical protein VH877_19095 [Polyangia bacterium]|jgi:hypothetical protein|nr:hypothetical protein [Polyangia bacterium]